MLGRLKRNLLVTFFYEEKKRSCFSGEESKLQEKREKSAVIVGENSKFPILHKLNSQ